VLSKGRCAPIGAPLGCPQVLELGATWKFRLVVVWGFASLSNRREFIVHITVDGSVLAGARAFALAPMIAKTDEAKFLQCAAD
jgi:hypothetical protein